MKLKTKYEDFNKKKNEKKNHQMKAKSIDFIVVIVVAVDDVIAKKY